MKKPEELAREDIDGALRVAGWAVQDLSSLDIDAARGVAIREYPLKSGHGFADYLLYVDGEAVGVVEAKKQGTPLTGVEVQTARYSEGLPSNLPARLRPLPFLYQSTGVETRFTNRLDMDARSRALFSFHRPETLAEWLDAEPLLLPTVGGKPAPQSLQPSTLRTRLRALPALEDEKLWSVQRTAVQNLEDSLAKDRPRALIQMATGSGKTFTAVTATWRLLQHAKARRVLFLVDRANLGRQALKEFQQYVTPEDGRKFTELYNVQLLASNKVDPVARVCITTIQRLYSMLKGEELDATDEEKSLFDTGQPLFREPVPVAYNPALPPEFFDIVFIDECHRSIYNLWRQVLEYFDAHLVGLTATPSKQTLGFFHRNLVMEYSHEKAVADGVNVQLFAYTIRTRITAQGSTVEAEEWVDKRDRLTRAVRWEQLDDDLSYGANQLDRDVVAMDQLRTVVRTFRDRLFTEIYPGRTEVPKTLVFAKDDSHADDIVQVLREEFGKGNDFAQKITYRTTGKKPEELISEFRNSYHPRIAVTVDMIATGTDIKSVEIVMFMRSVKSRNFFEQMKGRGVRVISTTDLKQATPDATVKDHFVLVDCVGLCEAAMEDSRPLECLPRVSFEKVLETVALGGSDAEVVSSIAARLARLRRRLGPEQEEALRKAAGGVPLQTLIRNLVEALDPDRHVEAARAAEKLPPEVEPSAEQVAKAARTLLKEAVAPLRRNAELRAKLLEVRQRSEQTVDVTSLDEVLEAGFSSEAREKLRSTVRSFEAFLREHKDEITALQVLYSQRWARRLKFADIQELADTIQATQRSWTPEALWSAYEQLDRDKVRGAGGQRLLTDIVSLVRFALGEEEALVPFAERVEERFANWLAQQENRSRRFTPEQRQWLALIKEHVATSLRIERDDFDEVPFNQRGGLGKVHQLFGGELEGLLEELNEVLVA